jgi:hypothetical protein
VRTGSGSPRRARGTTYAHPTPGRWPVKTIIILVVVVLVVLFLLGKFRSGKRL